MTFLRFFSFANLLFAFVFMAAMAFNVFNATIVISMAVGLGATVMGFWLYGTCQGWGRD